MKKTWFLILMGLSFAGCGILPKDSEPMKHDLSKYESREDFVKAIESADADADAFVEAIKTGPLRFRDVSAVALANYLEVFANEGMLKFIPFYFFYDEQMITSIETVFEDSENRSNNPLVHNVRYQAGR
jgi:hypothetical protein